ncbi:hypothetical protein ACFV8T_38640 [Streptomyces sp. NPDC059832]|uniref:hypothetical protein n=1 Tax=Streptomyces sp. NPDC059832 TaxID=3346966 RepID=UPI0036634BD3
MTAVSLHTGLPAAYIRAAPKKHCMWQQIEGAALDSRRIVLIDDTARRGALDHVLILGESHARKVLTDYQDHYNGHRLHRSRQQLPLSATEQPAIVYDLDDLDDRSMLRTRVLGGLINEYRYAA